MFRAFFVRRVNAAKRHICADYMRFFAQKAGFAFWLMGRKIHPRVGVQLLYEILFNILFKFYIYCINLIIIIYLDVIAVGNVSLHTRIINVMIRTSLFYIRNAFCKPEKSIRR